MIEEKLKEYTEDPHNLALENTMRERNGVPIILCVPLDEAILICQEAVDEAKPKRDKVEELFHKYKDCRGFNETGLIEYMSMKKFMELFDTEILPEPKN